MECAIIEMRSERWIAFYRAYEVLINIVYDNNTKHITLKESESEMTNTLEMNMGIIHQRRHQNIF